MPKELKLGDKVETMITGAIGTYGAEVVGFDRFEQPKLKVTRAPLGSMWLDVVLKDGDYIIWPDASDASVEPS